MSSTVLDFSAGIIPAKAIRDAGHVGAVRYISPPRESWMRGKPATAAEVARMLASYNLVSLPVVDRAHHLVGTVTVDDVLDYLLPDDWRSHDADDDASTQQAVRR